MRKRRADGSKRRSVTVASDDPAGQPPLCDEPEFTALIEGMVADEAPRVFAVVQEYGCRVDARIAAWGMAFTDHAEVVSEDRQQRLSLPGAHSACRPNHFGSHIRASIVWAPGAAP